MEIIRAKHMGFCFGVLEAINTCNYIQSSTKKKYILGMLVHNKFVVEDMKSKGFTIITEEEVLQDNNSLKEGDIVVIRAHGTSKEIYKKLNERKVEIYDATCLFVSNIRKEIEFATGLGYKILFVGDRNHPEVKGIISFSEDIDIFETLDEAKSVKIDKDRKYLLATQTTLNKKKFLEIKKFFMDNYDNVKILDKICGATSLRQKSVEDLAKKVDVMIIVGDRKSSNTKKLYEISKKLNSLSYLVESKEEINVDDFLGKKTLGIAAGASTPEVIIKDIENKIRGI